MTKIAVKSLKDNKVTCVEVNLTESEAKQLIARAKQLYEMRGTRLVVDKTVDVTVPVVRYETESSNGFRYCDWIKETVKVDYYVVRFIDKVIYDVRLQAELPINKLN